MGFFSFETKDTNKSIANAWQSIKPTFTVHMVAPNGEVFSEDNYDGYGVFGGKDYYELLAEINGGDNRDDGINMSFHPEEHAEGLLYPQFVEDVAKATDFNEECAHCEVQGYFYDDDDADDGIVRNTPQLDTGFILDCVEKLKAGESLSFFLPNNQHLAALPSKKRWTLRVTDADMVKNVSWDYKNYDAFIQQFMNLAKGAVKWGNANV